MPHESISVSTKRTPCVKYRGVSNQTSMAKYVNEQLNMLKTTNEYMIEITCGNILRNMFAAFLPFPSTYNWHINLLSNYLNAASQVLPTYGPAKVYLLLETFCLTNTCG
jgi:hypothetical protein